MTRALCTFQTYKDGRLMVCTLPMHVGEHLLWAGKPRLTSGNDCERGFDRGTIRGTETSGPGGASTPRDPADPDETGASNDER